MTRFNTTHNLAVGFVEALTEYDFTDMPESVQQKLLDAAEAMMRFMEPVTVVANEPRQQITEGGTQ